MERKAGRRARRVTGGSLEGEGVEGAGAGAGAANTCLGGALLFWCHYKTLSPPDRQPAGGLATRQSLPISFRSGSSQASNWVLALIRPPPYLHPAHHYWIYHYLGIVAGCLLCTVAVRPDWRATVSPSRRFAREHTTVVGDCAPGFAHRNNFYSVVTVLSTM